MDKCGGKGLALQVDLRYEDQVKQAIDKTVETFGGIDILINNASAISLTGTEDTDMKRYDLMHSINTRGTFLASKLAIPYLKKSKHAHILNMSPPLIMKSIWFRNHVAYTMAKYGMSMCVLGMADELKDDNIAVNALWPRTAIWTAAMNMIKGGDEGRKCCRKPDILADAAYCILSKSPSEFTGNFVIDEELLISEGITDMEQYAEVPGEQLMDDFFLPDKYCRDDSPYADSGKKEEKSSSLGKKVDKVFDQISIVMNDELKKQINALLLFQISDKNYLLDARESKPFKISHETPSENPDITMIAQDEDFVKIAKGEVKATNAFMAGKLKIKGNIQVAMKLEKLFGQLKPKL